MYFEEALELLRSKGGYIYSKSWDEYKYSFGYISLMTNEKDKWPTLLKTNKTGPMTDQYGWGIPLNSVRMDDWEHIEDELIFESIPKGEEWIKEEFRVFLFQLFMNIYGPWNLYLIPDPKQSASILINLLKDEGVLKCGGVSYGL